MLYEAVPERILREGYRMKYVSVPGLGARIKHVPVYASKSGEEVFEHEATIEGVAIIERPVTNPSRSEREQAIQNLIDVMLREPPIADFQSFTNAIAAMSLEADLQLYVGKLLAGKLVADEFYHERPQAHFVIRFLVASQLKDAIEPLTSLLALSTSTDHALVEDSVDDLVRSTLRAYIVGKLDFQHAAARAAVDLCGRLGAAPFYKNRVKSWAIELLTQLVDTPGEERGWANDRL